jgi:hypothetical protein
MNHSTKNDLSGSKVKLDYEALRTCAAVAVGRSLDAISEDIAVIRSIPQCDPVSMYMAAARIKDAAGSLAIAADTLAALNEGNTRENVEIVNKPAIPAEKE